MSRAKENGYNPHKVINICSPRIASASGGFSHKKGEVHMKKTFKWLLDDRNDKAVVFAKEAVRSFGNNGELIETDYLITKLAEFVEAQTKVEEEMKEIQTRRD